MKKESKERKKTKLCRYLRKGNIEPKASYAQPKPVAVKGIGGDQRFKYQHVTK